MCVALYPDDYRVSLYTLMLKYFRRFSCNKESFLDYGDLGHFFRKNASFHPSVQRENNIKLEKLIRNLFQMSSLLKLKCSDQKPDNFLYKMNGDTFLYKMNGDTLDKIVFTDFGVDFCCDYNPSCTVRRCKSAYPNPWIHAMVMMLQISVYAAIYNKTYSNQIVSKLE